MSKGTPSMGRKSGKITNLRCRRCGRRSYHKTKKVCSHCGYGKTAKIRKYNWMKLRKARNG